MNFDFSDDQQAIKRTAKDFLAARFTAERVRELAEAGTYDDDAWKEICELGWPGIFVSEEHGGQGLGIVELVILMEELGYALAPLPFLSGVAAGLALEVAGSDEQRERWLPGIASGELRAHRRARVERRGAAGAGRRGRRADRAARAATAAGCSRQARRRWSRSTRSTPPAASRASGRTAATRCRATPGPALDRIAVALAAELTGVAQRTMEMAVEYARDRKQFGRPIGAYQAVSHRCAQMLLETEGARSASYYAAWTADAEPESLPLAASMAKAYASDAAWRVTASSLQVHGGIGFTWEHDLHFFLKRAKADGTLFGSASEHRDRVAELSGLASEPAPA